MFQSGLGKSVGIAFVILVMFVFALIFIEKDKAQGMDVTPGETAIYASQIYFQKVAKLNSPTEADLKMLLSETLPPWTSSSGPTSWHYIWTVEDPKDFIFCIEFRVKEDKDVEELGFIYDFNTNTTNIQSSCGKKPKDVSAAKAL